MLLDDDLVDIDVLYICAHLAPEVFSLSLDLLLCLHGLFDRNSELEARLHVPLALETQLVVGPLSLRIGTIDEGLVHLVLVLEEGEALSCRRIGGLVLGHELSLLVADLLDVVFVLVVDDRCRGLLAVEGSLVGAGLLVGVSFLDRSEDMLHVVAAVRAVRLPDLGSLLDRLLLAHVEWSLTTHRVSLVGVLLAAIMRCKLLELTRVHE